MAAGDNEAVYPVPVGWKGQFGKLANIGIPAPTVAEPPIVTVLPCSFVWLLFFFVLVYLFWLLSALLVCTEEQRLLGDWW